MHWLKLYTEIVNDPKIQLLEPSDRWHYIVLLCAKADGLFEIKPALTQNARGAAPTLIRKNELPLRKAARGHAY